MAHLQSKLNPRAQTFRDNAAAMRLLVDDLNAKLARIAEGGGVPVMMSPSSLLR